MSKKRGLAKGFGLDALLGSIQKEQQNLNHESSPTDEQLQSINIQWLQRGEYQPRSNIHDEDVQELAESIKQHGVMQPIIIREIKSKNQKMATHHSDETKRYEIIAGERRWRAAKLAGLTEIPAIVRDIPDQVAIALALIENIQRQDLNPIEQALALQRFHDEFGLSHQEIADTVGKARATVSNLLRLLSLEDSVKTLLSEQKLDMGHARAIITLKKAEQRQVAHQVIKKSLSVRQTEQLVRDMVKAKQPIEQQKAPISNDIQQLTHRLAERFGAQVNIAHKASGKGQIVIKYHSLDELDGILNICLTDEESA